ncbi:MAG TPA: phage holin family protein [Patescibacteria group bacterium]|nr:phage holin family protein [Patescibacteria group bacterium]
MKSLLRLSIENALSLFLLTLFLSGVKVSGGWESFILDGVILALVYKILKPIISIITLPLNLLTMGGFRFITNVLVFYFATKIASNITISAFTFPGASFSGFIIPQIYFNTLFAYFAAAFFQSLFVSAIEWLRR